MWMWMWMVVLTLASAEFTTTTTTTTSTETQSSTQQPHVSSWPTRHHFLELTSIATEGRDGDGHDGRTTLSKGQKLSYLEYMKGCHEDDDDDDDDDGCNSYEQRRIQENYVQPPWIKRNHHHHYYYHYTTLGYTTRRIPSESYKALSQFFTTNAAGPSFLPYHHREDDTTKTTVLSFGIWNEFWSAGYIYWNHWIRSGSNDNNNNGNDKKGSSIVDVGRTDLTYRFHDNQYATLIDGVRRAVEEWTSTTVVLQASYGIRIYREGSIVAPHVDKLPFVLTAMLHIDDNLLDDDDEHEPWIYELIGHDGLAHNVTTKKGEMLLYEGASVIHGRPYPMKSKRDGAVPSYMACLYMHFEPIGYTAGIHRSHNINGQEHDQDQGNIHIMGSLTTEEIDLASKELFELALKQQQQQQQQQDTAAKQQQSTSPRAVPRYVWPQYVDTYTQKSFYYKFEEKIYPKPTKLVFGSITAHQAASLGDLKALKEMAKTTTDRTELFKADINGWRPIHEAARSGYADILEFLLEEGAQVNQRTNDGLGGNALYWAEKDPVKNEKAIAVLKKYGAVNLPPLTDAQRREKRKREEEELQQRKEPEQVQQEQVQREQQQEQQQQQQPKDKNKLVIVQA
jgi:prolyl 4-hydroxylase